MPIKKGFIVSVLFLSVAFSWYFYQNTRKPQKISSSFLQSEFTGKGVVDRTIQLKLNFDKKNLNSELVEISAEVRLPFDFNDKLFFRWKLGQDVFLIDGNLNGQVDGLLKNETKKVIITVTGFSKESNHHIGFEIYGIKNGKNIFADGLIASDLENTFENTVQNVEKIKASQ